MIKIIKESIKKIIGEDRVHKIIYSLGIINYKKFKKYKNKKKIFYMLVPTHGNLGDQAIAYASVKYLNDHYKDYEIIEVNSDDTYRYSKCISKVINNDDIIFLHGGGNMGNLYLYFEKERRFVIDHFPNNKIISFTQTMFFSEDDKGKNELLITKKIYNNHNNLTLIAREEKSYNTMKEHFKNANIILCPDIVFYLNDRLKFNCKNRNRIMTCLRADKESIVDSSEKNNFIRNLEMNYNNVLINDTVVHKDVYKEDREKELFNIWEEYSKSSVVITDRLHGMVFAAITKTPCIVTKSLDHKVIGTYEWIKELNYIKLVDNLNYDRLNNMIEELINLKDYTEIDLDTNNFSKLKEKIK